MKTINPSFNAERIHIVQHSSWNEGHYGRGGATLVGPHLHSLGVEYYGEAIVNGGWYNSNTYPHAEIDEFMARANASTYKPGFDAAFAFYPPDRYLAGCTNFCGKRLDFTDTNELMAILKQNKNSFSKMASWFDNYDGAAPPAATCSDGIQNQTETGVDCGGPCSACSSGTTLIDANFASGASGFTYADNMFRSTSNAAFASGVHGTGKLNVTVGGAMTAATSGGWSKSFTTTSSGTVSVSFKYSMSTADGIDPGEWVETLVMINNTLYGASPNDYVRRIEGGGAQVEVTRTFTSASLAAGTHTIKIGAYMNAATAAAETGSMTIDDVLVTKP
ncbi:MAG: N,N-dimethylformamidase beta subunit [Pseudomonadota bacterium]|jgi:hypothetical protein